MPDMKVVIAEFTKLRDVVLSSKRTVYAYRDVLLRELRWSSWDMPMPWWSVCFHSGHTSWCQWSRCEMHPDGLWSTSCWSWAASHLHMRCFIICKTSFACWSIGWIAMELHPEDVFGMSFAIERAYPLSPWSSWLTECWTWSQRSKIFAWETLFTLISKQRSFFCQSIWFVNSQTLALPKWEQRVHCAPALPKHLWAEARGCSWRLRDEMAKLKVIAVMCILCASPSPVLCPIWTAHDEALCSAQVYVNVTWLMKRQTNCIDDGCVAFRRDFKNHDQSYL